MTDVEKQTRSRVSGESRRSTRVPLRVVIEAQGIAEPLVCAGETIIVNMHGALISSSVALSVGMKIEIHVYLTVNVQLPRWSTLIREALRCGIELTTPQNLVKILPPKRLA